MRCRRLGAESRCRDASIYTLGETSGAHRNPGRFGGVRDTWRVPLARGAWICPRADGRSTGNRDSGNGLRARNIGHNAAIAVGGYAALAALWAGPAGGGSIRPARSLGPAVVGGSTGQLWIHIVGPLVGAFARRASGLDSARAPRAQRPPHWPWGR
ncbi:aquaporin [Streptomyces sp. NPDC097617]|uniref:aquaporin n=1 Tax=Streptomyces sp. NPDC097617 TaxID=3366091 RepID=UPI00380B04CC